VHSNNAMQTTSRFQDTRPTSPGDSHIRRRKVKIR
jgi:hypothetical protein